MYSVVWLIVVYFCIIVNRHDEGFSQLALILEWLFKEYKIL